MRDYYEDETIDSGRDRTHGERRRDRSRSAFFESGEQEDSYWRPSYSFDERRGRRSEECDPEFGSDAYRQGLARDETRRLIASDKVEGTPIYDRNGRKLGSIHNLMLDKLTGEVVYAVVRHSSGFLGLDERYFPLDWCDLTYDTRAHGYGVEFTEEDLERRLSREESRRARMAERERSHSAFESYRPRFYW